MDSLDLLETTDGIVQGQNLIVDNTGIVGSVDLVTGELTEILDTNIALTDIDVDSDGNVFGIDSSQLYSIDLQTRTTTPIGSYGVSVLNALEIAEDGTLYATGLSQDVFTIDSGTGEATSIGTSPISIQSAGDLQFINGILYLSDTEDLIALDVSEGTLDDATVIGSFNLQGESIWGITIDEDGDAVGLTNNGSILNLNLDTGEATSIGTVENNTAINGAAALPEGFLDDLSAGNDEGLSIQLQVFSPNLETPISEAVTTTIDDDVEFGALPSIELPGESLVDVNIDITQEGEGIGSIFFEVDPNEAFLSFASGEFNGYVFTDISDQIPAIENVTIDESTNTLGLEADDVTFSENSIEVNVESLAYRPGLSALVNVEFADI